MFDTDTLVFGTCSGLAVLIVTYIKVRKVNECLQFNYTYPVPCQVIYGLIRYSGFSIIQTGINRIRTLGCRLTSTCFQYQREKDVAVTGVLLQEKAKLLHEQLFQTLQHFFHAVLDLVLAERSRKRCSTCTTLYYSAAN